MKKLILACALTLAASTLLAGEGKSCEMKSKGKPVSLSGIVACKGDDCTFKTAKSTYAVCEMSKADVPKLASAGMVNVTGKLLTSAG